MLFSILYPSSVIFPCFPYCRKFDTLIVRFIFSQMNVCHMICFSTNPESGKHVLLAT